LVRWGHPALPRPQVIVLLADCSRLVAVADWSGGAAVQVDSETVVVRSVAWDELRVPREAVVGLVFALHERWQDRQRLEDLVREHRGEKDTLLLANQDQVSGRLAKLTGGSLSIDVGGRATEMPLSRVAAIALGASRQPSVVSRRSKLVVGMRDGSLLYATKVSGAADNLALELTGGGKLSGGNVDDVVALVGSGGGKIVYLSDLEPTDYRHVPYLSIAWPYRADRNVLGRPLMVGGKRYLKGLGMHSAARLTYRLDGKFRQFDALAALDDSSEGGGSVTFGVYVLRNEQWRQAATSDTVRGGAPPEPVSVDVRGAEMITLTVDYADRGDELDHADWLDARLMRN
jgi:NPCBM/NEW2 domain